MEKRPAIATEKKLTSISRHLFCAGFSASFASGVTAPLDVIRIRRQLFGELNSAANSVFCYYQTPGNQAAINVSGLDIVKRTVRYEGLQGFWTGYSSEAFRQWTYGVARIGLHRVFTGRMSELKNGAALTITEVIGCAAAAGAVAVPFQIPFDKIKVRQIKDTWCQGFPRYRNVFHGLSILRTCPQFVTDFNKVLPAAMARTVVNNVAGIATFDLMKQKVGPELEASHATKTLLFSAVSSCCVTLCMAPLDSLRNRIIAAPTRYTGLTMAFFKILKDEGPLGLYRGAGVTAGANWIHNFIILNTFEHVGNAWDMFNQ
uniref:ADP,ATP carrier protein n=1 Tax=Norrisiella sphaerica TaxID=552664 RepID=A0A7S2VUZ5_9EUKA|mmetsp:Transcript_2376/g.3433  ORF Transcript_2376/g.3433 Transcript_2376/m.3433 type:complete len:317 (+) Transcript_2376:237-1187(+)